MTEKFPEMAEVLPHSGRMILLDKIVEFKEDSITCSATVGSFNPYLSENSVVGPWIALEYMSQALAAHAGMEFARKGESPGVGFLLGTRKFTNFSKHGFTIGQSLCIIARRSWQDGGMAVCQAEIYDQSTDQLLCEASLSVYRPTSSEALREIIGK